MILCQWASLQELCNNNFVADMRTSAIREPAIQDFSCLAVLLQLCRPLNTIKLAVVKKEPFIDVVGGLCYCGRVDTAVCGHERVEWVGCRHWRGRRWPTAVFVWATCLRRLSTVSYVNGCPWSLCRRVVRQPTARCFSDPSNPAVTSLDQQLYVCIKIKYIVVCFKMFVNYLRLLTSYDVTVFFRVFSC